MSVHPASSGRMQRGGRENRAAAGTYPGINTGTAWLAAPAPPSPLALSTREVTFKKKNQNIPYKSISKLWGCMSKMLPLPEALAHPESGCIFWGQWANSLFVKCAATELNSTTTTSFSLLRHLKASYLARYEEKKKKERGKKCTLQISSAYSPHDCPLVSADRYRKDKNGPLDPEQNPLFKLRSYLWAYFSNITWARKPHFMTRRITATPFVLTRLLSQLREYPDQHELHQGLGVPLILCLLSLDKVLDGLLTVFAEGCFPVLPVFLTNKEDALPNVLPLRSHRQKPSTLPQEKKKQQGFQFIASLHIFLGLCALFFTDS